MNTTKILTLVLLFAGCGSSMQVVQPPPDGGSPDVIVTAADLSGPWSFSMTPFDRVQTTVPAPCSGTMMLAKAEGGGYAGSWACDDGRAGSVDATPNGSQFIVGVWTPSFSGDRDRWLYSFVDVSAHSLKGANFSATR